MGLLLLQYLGLSFLVVFSSIKISQCVDELDQRTNLGGALIGGILLAGVTSLPELMTSLASTMVSQEVKGMTEVEMVGCHH